MDNNLNIYDSLDDLLISTYQNILTSGKYVTGKRGDIVEKVNFMATLKNPRNRTSSSLDRKLVKSKFGELAWYFTGDKSRDFIIPYIQAYNKEKSENNKILGAYGPKIFNK